MIIIQIFFKYFTKQKFKKIQIYSQILISIICTVLFIGMILNINNKLNEIKSLTAISNVKGNFYIDNNYESSNSVDEVNNEMNNLISDINNHHGDFEFCQFSCQSSIEETTQLYIDNNLIKNINFPVYKGRTLNDKDFSINYNTDCIPILISKRLENKYPLNSEFKWSKTSFTNENNYINGGAKFKVVGIIEDSSKFWIMDDVLVDTLNYFNVVIFPINFNKIGINPPYYFIKVNNEKNYNNFKNHLQLKHQNIKLIDSSLKKGFINKLKDKIIELIFIGVFTTVLLILSLFGFISIIQSTILLRNKEIGIHYCLGASKKNIISFILADTLLISMSSLCICYLAIYKFKDYFMLNYEILIDNNTFLISTIVIFIYVFITMIIITITVLKKDPIELLRD